MLPVVAGNATRSTGMVRFLTGGDSMVEPDGGFVVEAREVYDPFQDEEPMECGLEDPEVCESCQ